MLFDLFIIIRKHIKAIRSNFAGLKLLINGKKYQRFGLKQASPYQDINHNT